MRVVTASTLKGHQQSQGLVNVSSYPYLSYKNSTWHKVGSQEMLREDKSWDLAVTSVLH